MGRAKNELPVFEPPSIDEKSYKETRCKIRDQLFPYVLQLLDVEESYFTDLPFPEQLEYMAFGLTDLQDALANFAIVFINRAIASDIERAKDIRGGRFCAPPRCDKEAYEEKRTAVKRLNALQDFLGVRPVVHGRPAFLAVKKSKGQEAGVYCLIYFDDRGVKRTTSGYEVFPPISWCRRDLDRED